MARGRILSIDEKIEKAREAVIRAKQKYEDTLAELESLQAKKEMMKKEELMKAIETSDRSYEEIIAFLNTERTVE